MAFHSLADVNTDETFRLMHKRFVERDPTGSAVLDSLEPDRDVAHSLVGLLNMTNGIEKSGPLVQIIQSIDEKMCESGF